MGYLERFFHRLNINRTLRALPVISVLFLLGCTMEASIFSKNLLNVSNISGKLVGYSNVSQSAQVSISSSSCEAPVARLYRLNSDGTMMEPAIDSTNVDEQGVFHFNSQNGGLSSFSEMALVTEVRDCDSKVYFRPITGFANQDVTMASSLLGFVLNTEKKEALRLALQMEPQKVSSLMELLGAANSMQQAYDILNSSPEAKDRFSQLFGVDPEILLNASPVVVETHLPTQAQEKIPVNMEVQATHWSSSYSFAYQWKFDSKIIGSAANLDFSPGGDSQGTHVLSLTMGISDGIGGIDTSKPFKTLHSNLEVSNNVLPLSPNFLVTNPATSGGLPVNSRNLTVTINTGASQIHCDSFKNLQITETATLSDPMQSFSVSCTQNDSQEVSYSLTSAGDGVKTLYLWTKDSAGAISSTPTSYSFTLDTVAPTVQILNQPLAQSKSSSQSFTFSGDDGDGSIALFECKMDSGAWGLCSSPVSYVGLLEGDHTVRVRATDTAGNISTPASKTWHIDLTPPILNLAGPNSLTNSLFAVFNLSATDQGGSGLGNYECSIDGASYVSCAAINNHTLAAGSHTFKARAYDGAGNVSSVKTHAWTIDTTLPTVTLTAKPTSVTNSMVANFSFIGSDSGGGNIAGFECQLDGAAFVSCSTGQSYSALEDGSHTFKVRSLDTAGNIGNAVTFTWSVDTATPLASLHATPESITNQTSATFAFSATAPVGGSIVGYECQLEGGPWISCTSPNSYGSLTEGSHVFAVRSIDNNLNISDPTSYNWTVDLTNPVLTLEAHPDALSNSPNPQFKFSATDTGGGEVDTFLCQVDGGGYSSCSTPRDLSGLSQGTHTFEIKVKDTAGNVSVVQSYTWVIDQQAPLLALLTTPDSLTNSTSAMFTISAMDSGGGTIAGIFCSLDNATASACVSGVSYDSLAAGVHSFAIYALDSAGNTSDSLTFAWTVDLNAPTVSLTGKPSANWNSAGASFNFTATDTGGSSVAGFSCQIDGNAFASCVSGVSYSSLSEGAHTFKVYATDVAGNQSAMVGHTWNVDTVVPVVTIATPSADEILSVGSLSAVTLGGTCSENNSTVTVAGIAGVSAACVAGNWSVSVNFSGLADGSYSLSASQTDAAGNVGASPLRVLIKDATAPVITLTAPTVAQGGGMMNLSWVTTEAHVATGSSFQVELYNGTTWSALGNLVATAGANTVKSYAMNGISVPSLNTPSAKLRVSLMDAAGNTATTTSASFIIDSEAPVLASLTVNNGQPATSNNNVRVGLSVTDALSNISKICMKTTSTDPDVTNSCWVAVSSYGLIPAKNLSTPNIYYNVGFVSGTYQIYLWLMDAAGNITTNTETVGLDKGGVTYNSPTPPLINAVQLTSTDTPGNPPAGNDLAVSAGENIYLKWNISSSTGLSAAPIKISYSTNDTSETGVLAPGLGNTANGGCTVTAGFTGCAILPAPVGTYFRLKLTVTDIQNFSTSITTNPLNSGSVRFLAGNTDLGLGSNAKAAVLKPVSANSLAVLDDGRIFVADERGLAWVNPSTGVYEIIAGMAGSSSGDGGVLTSAKFKSWGGLWVDNNNDILVADGTILRKINTRLNPMTISRFIGGGTDSSDYVATATNFKAVSSISRLRVSSNGDIYFKSDSGNKIRKYSTITGAVTALNFSGTGNSYSSTQNNSLCDTDSFFVTFTANGEVEKMIWKIIVGPSSSACPSNIASNEKHAYAQVDPVTGISYMPLPGYVNSVDGFREFGNFYTDKSGNVYMANSGTSGPIQAVYKFNSSMLTWSKYYGSGYNGTCPDGTLQSDCAISASALAFNSQGQIFYMDGKAKVVRTIDNEGRVRTLVGDRLGSDDGRQSLATRFNGLTDVRSWNSEGESYITVFDFSDARLREFNPGSTIYSVAGAQYSKATNPGLAAAGNPFSVSADSYAKRIQIADNGDIYMNRIGGYVAKIVRQTGLWEDVVSGVGYGPSLIALNGDKLLLNTFSYSATYGAVDSRHVLVDIPSQTMGIVVRYGGGVTTPSTICPDETPLNACLNTGLPKDSGYQGAYDSVTNSWLIPEHSSTRIAKFAVNGSGTMGTFFRTARVFTRFDIHRTADLSVNHVFICASTGKLYKYDLNNGNAETELPLPNSTFTCGLGLRYDSFRNSLLFTFSQNGLNGVAEYVNP
ncbi:Ig-like domain repeat protein [Bdellovibrio sp. HCB290]|uniref:Ig-like domain repeat protein n=1 Tax=Bdellovibrio sp. HCB290 TaxID=3394356 RepID=UPI0039B41D03